LNLTNLSNDTAAHVALLVLGSYAHDTPQTKKQDVDSGATLAKPVSRPRVLYGTSNAS